MFGLFQCLFTQDDLHEPVKQDSQWPWKETSLLFLHFNNIMFFIIVSPHRTHTSSRQEESPNLEEDNFSWFSENGDHFQTQRGMVLSFSISVNVHLLIVLTAICYTLLPSPLDELVASELRSGYTSTTCPTPGAASQKNWQAIKTSSFNVLTRDTKAHVTVWRNQFSNDTNKCHHFDAIFQMVNKSLYLWQITIFLKTGYVNPESKRTPFLIF